MKQCFLGVLGSLLVLVGSAASQSNASPVSIGSTTSEKFGTCPSTAPLGTVLYRDECYTDSHCSGNLKCCRSGNYYYCTAPAIAPVPVAGQDKFGTCPAAAPLGTVLYRDECYSDSHCSGNLKCCRSGLYYYCAAPGAATNPVFSNPGSCPMVRPGSFGNCAAQCSGDSMCPSYQKCCSNGCGFSCQTAVSTVVRAGSCPAITFQVDSAMCERRCGQDSECQGTQQKCCSNGCGTRCVNPASSTGSLDQKLGTCASQNSFTGGCADTCSTDSQCGGTMKCCRNACAASVCALPVMPRESLGSV